MWEKHQELSFIIIYNKFNRRRKEKFNSEDGFNAVMIERVRTADGEPVVYCIDKLAKEILPDLSGYNEESLLTVIHKQYAQTYHIRSCSY